MKRTVVMLVSIGVLLGSLGAVEAGPKPVRSGTIVGGTGVEVAGGSPWENPATTDRLGCQYALDCLAWLQTGCNPALAGHEPAATASIVDVGALADGRTRRSFHMVAPHIPPWGLWPGAVVQLWRQNCTEIPQPAHPVVSPQNCEGHDGGVRCTGFRIPTGAKWMTVSGKWTTVHLTWTLA